MAEGDWVRSLPGLVTLWDFQQPEGGRAGVGGEQRYALRERGGAVPRVSPPGEGAFGPYAARFLEGGGHLAAARADCPALNLHGPRAQVSVVTWLRREPAPASRAQSCQAVAGMWNEHGKRQYCLFLNLRIHDSAEQVGAHVSAIGGATPGFKYCMDAAIGATGVDLERWHCAAVTYDGTFARAYLDGRLDARGDRNPYRYEGGLFDGGRDGADFTVGAVTRPERVDEERREHGSVVANRFYGLLGGLAVFRRALSDDEVRRLAALTPR